MTAAPLCPKCQGRGTFLDDDPYADRRQWVTCRECGGVPPQSVPQQPTLVAKSGKPAPVLPPGVRLVGKSDVGGKALAAIVDHALAPSARALVYRHLVAEARQQMALAKRWGVWGVFASDDWASIHRGHHTAP